MPRPLLVLLALTVLAAPHATGDGKLALVFRPAKPAPHRWYAESSHGFHVQNSEWKAGVWTPRYHSLQYLHRAAILHLPERSIAVGDSWNRTLTIENISSGPVVILAGTATLKRIETVEGRTLGRIEGRFALKGTRKGSANAIYRLKSFKLTYQATYDVQLGAISTAAYVLLMDADYTSGGKTRQLTPLPGGVLTYRTRSERLAAERKKALEQRKDPMPPVTRAEIDLAIQRGVGYLIKSQGKDGRWPSQHASTYPIGPTALAVLALLKSDVKVQHPAIGRGFKAILKRPPSRTYEVGLVCMALHALCDALQPKRKPARGHRCRLSGSGRKLLATCVKTLVGSGHEGAWSYGGGQSASARSYDHSNTQYAVLGLRSASLCGMDPGPGEWTRIVDHFLTAQERDYGEPGPELSGGGSANPRGWTYSPNHGGGVPYTSMTMTCAGVASLMIAAERLESRRRLDTRRGRQVRAAIDDGIAWIGFKYPASVRPNAKTTTVKRANGYLLYGLERVGVLASKDRFESWDWYREGARLLIDAQNEKTGEFVGSYQGTAETAFGLLFLKRATMPVGVLEISRMSSGGKKKAPKTPPKK